MNPTDEQLLNDYELATNAQRNATASQNTDEHTQQENTQEQPQLSFEEKMKYLNEKAARATKGFHATNTISYRGSRLCHTLERPTNLCNYAADKEDQIYLEPKTYYPVLSNRDMARPMPMKAFKRPHRVSDPNYVAPIPTKPGIISEPVYPKSYKDGVKLRDPEQILRELEAKKKSAAVAPSSAPPVRVQVASKQPESTLPNPIKDVLSSVTGSFLSQKKNQRSHTPSSSIATSSRPFTNPSSDPSAKKLSSSTLTSRDILKDSPRVPKTDLVHPTNKASAPLKTSLSYDNKSSSSSSSNRSAKTPLTNELNDKKHSYNKSGSKTSSLSTQDTSLSASYHEKTSSSPAPGKIVPKAPWSSNDKASSSTSSKPNTERKIPTSSPTVTVSGNKKASSSELPVSKPDKGKGKASVTSITSTKNEREMKASSSGLQKTFTPVTFSEQSPPLSNRPRYSGKITPTQTTVANDDFPELDLIEAHKYMARDYDEMEYKKISALATPLQVTSGEKPTLDLILADYDPEILDIINGRNTARNSSAAIKGKSKKNTASQASGTKDPPKSKKPLKRPHDDDPLDSAQPATSKRKTSLKSVKKTTKELPSQSKKTVQPIPTETDSSRSTKTSKARSYDMISEADLEEGETRSPSPIKKQKLKSGASKITKVSPQVSTKHPEPKVSHSQQPHKLSESERVSKLLSPQNLKVPDKQPKTSIPKHHVPHQESSSPKHIQSISQRDSSHQVHTLSPSRQDGLRHETPRHSPSPKKHEDDYSDPSFGRSDSSKHHSKTITTEKPEVISAIKTSTHTDTQTKPDVSGPHKSAAGGSLPEEYNEYKLNQVMYNALATASKHRGDENIKTKAGVLDHLHALCGYIMSFYYSDKMKRHSIQESAVHWKSLISFTDTLMRHLDANDMADLKPLCIRLTGLIRLYLFKRFRDTVPPVPSEDNEDAIKAYMEHANAVFRESFRATESIRSSESSMGYGGLCKNFPVTFKDACILGDLTRGYVEGPKETPISAPMVPLQPHCELHHSSLVARMILLEYTERKGINFTPLAKPEDYM